MRITEPVLERLSLGTWWGSLWKSWWRGGPPGEEVNVLNATVVNLVNRELIPQLFCWVSKMGHAHCRQLLTVPKWHQVMTSKIVSSLCRTRGLSWSHYSWTSGLCGIVRDELGWVAHERFRVVGWTYGTPRKVAKHRPLKHGTALELLAVPRNYTQSAQLFCGHFPKWACKWPFRRRGTHDSLRSSE